VYARRLVACLVNLAGVIQDEKTLQKRRDMFYERRATVEKQIEELRQVARRNARQVARRNARQVARRNTRQVARRNTRQVMWPGNPPKYSVVRGQVGVYAGNQTHCDLSRPQLKAICLPVIDYRLKKPYSSVRAPNKKEMTFVTIIFEEPW
jgi:hypothetical protein